MASGKYIVFVDSDDWIEPGYLDMIVNHADHADALIVGYYTDDKRCLNKPWAEEGIYEGEALKIIWESMFSAGGGILDKIYKASLAKQAVASVPDDLYVSEDRCIGTHVFLHSKRIKVLNMGGYHWFANNGSITRSVHKDHLLNEHLYYQTMLKMIDEHPFKEHLLKAFNESMRSRLFMAVRLLGIDTSGFWYYPYYGRLENARIILYGAGEVGKSYYESISRKKKNVIAAWVDRDFMAEC